MASEHTIISSPGKVLAVGGYLVLDPAYSGVVLSTSSRFYSVIQSGHGTNQIQVRSPQFIDAVWTYSVELDEKTIKVEQITNR
jgi:phosphomevalonate kinase